MKKKTEEEDFLPEDGYSEEDYAYIEDDELPRRGSGLVAVLGIVTVLCALVLAGLLAWSLMGSGGKQGGENTGARMDASQTADPSETTEETTVPPEANPYNQYDFQYDRQNYMTCLAQESYVGVDVSAFQKKINWALVKNSGIQFAMLRLGYRGYGAAGNMVEDEYIQRNLKETAAVGLPIGVYFFSQATNLQEVQEEIDYMLKILGDYKVQYPVVLDWEIVTAEGRTKSVDRRTLTNMLRYYIDEMTARGYQPMIYFNWTQASKLLYLNELEDAPFWLALYQDRMTYPFRVEMWQYTCTGTVPGIEGDVDINIYIPDRTK